MSPRSLRASGRLGNWSLWPVVAAVGLYLAIAVPTTLWRPIGERFAPMTRRSSQCLVCQRTRHELSLCGKTVEDSIATNEYSDWIDSFTPAHPHVWLVATNEVRQGWFGGHSIGCGGTPVIAEICRRRGALGEERARQLMVRLHELVQSPDFKPELSRLDAFTDAAMHSPDLLLESR